MLLFLSSSIFADEINKKHFYTKGKVTNKLGATHKIHIKNDLNKKFYIGQYTIVLTRVDSRMNRIHLNSRPRNKTLIVEAFDPSGKKMNPKRVGENLSTPSTSNHKYMYDSVPEYLVIK